MPAASVSTSWANAPGRRLDFCAGPVVLTCYKQRMRALFCRFRSSLLLLAGIVLFLGVPSARAELPPLGPIPAEASGPSIDPAAATRAYLATIPPEAKTRSDAYFEGGYWLILWNALLSVALSLLVLFAGWSARWRDWTERVSRFRFVRYALYGAVYTLVIDVLSFPLLWYEGFRREHQYGMATQDFGAWFAEQRTGLFIQIVLAALFFPTLYAVFRRAPRTWWVWGSGVVMLFAVFGTVIGPSFISPLFNKYTALEDPVVRDPILAMARANQIPVEHVYAFDASKQTRRVSANVDGGFGFARINLNDNLLKRCSLPEIRQVMAHEMGHYVLGHTYKLLLEGTGLVLVLAFFTRLTFDALVRRFGARWRVTGIAAPAGFPVLALVLTVFGLLATPILNTLVREVEGEADAFGINTSREPDGFAQSAIKLGEYRKMDPGPWEEFIFFDHPSGRARIRMAMDWKAAHLPAGGEMPPPLP